MIQDYEVSKGQTPLDASVRQGHICIWEGDIEILRENVYVTKISIIADGEDMPQPICDIPFSMNKGYYLWVPAINHDDPNYFDELALIAQGQVIKMDAVSPYPKELTENAKYGKKDGEE